MRKNLVILGAMILFVLALTPLQAQAQEGVRGPVSHEHVISGDPLVLLAGWFNAEYERKISESTTVGISGGWLDLNEDDYTNVSGFLRYYPRDAAFSGFYIGGRAGVYNVGAYYVDEESGSGSESSHNALGLGVDIGYAWLLGPGRSFFVSLGIGATGLIGDFSHASKFIPASRLIHFGVAF